MFNKTNGEVYKKSFKEDIDIFKNLYKIESKKQYMYKTKDKDQKMGINTKNNNKSIDLKDYKKSKIKKEKNLGHIEISGYIYKINTKTPILYINNIFVPGVSVIFGENGSGKTTLIKNISGIFQNNTLEIKSYKPISISTDKIYADIGLSTGQEKIIKNKYMIENSQHILIDEPFANIDQQNRIKFIRYLIVLNKELIKNKSRCVILFTNDKKFFNIIRKFFVTYIIKENKVLMFN